ncbi:hypothetical protein N8009_01635 [Flavobacteriaceae bacterium]|nr:hypothetical protein [Flavobacteriaceae bacterium]
MYQPDKKGNSLHANPHKSQEDFRVSAYNTLIEAKDNPKAVGAYFNFINAYNLMEKGDSSFGNTCCLAVDLAEKQITSLSEWLLSMLWYTLFEAIHK